MFALLEPNKRAENHKVYRKIQIPSCFGYTNEQRGGPCGDSKDIGVQSEPKHMDKFVD